MTTERRLTARRRAAAGARRVALAALLTLTLTTLAPAAWGAPPLSAQRHDLMVPLLTQVGEKSNCGPTAAAMLLGGYQRLPAGAALTALRDTLGAWSWDRFPLRQVRLPGYDAGMTTPGMLAATLETFGGAVRFKTVGHRWLPAEAWSLVTLDAALADGRPLLVLAQSATLWSVPSPGLHWVVVRGIEDGRVVFNDPADGTRSSIPIARFWAAWRLDEIYRALPLIGAFQALVADRPMPPPRGLAASRFIQPERAAPRAL